MLPLALFRSLRGFRTWLERPESGIEATKPRSSQPSKHTMVFGPFSASHFQRQLNGIASWTSRQWSHLAHHHYQQEDSLCLAACWLPLASLTRSVPSATICLFTTENPGGQAASEVWTLDFPCSTEYLCTVPARDLAFQHAARSSQLSHTWGSPSKTAIHLIAHSPISLGQNISWEFVSGGACVWRPPSHLTPTPGQQQGRPGTRYVRTATDYARRVSDCVRIRGLSILSHPSKIQHGILPLSLSLESSLALALKSCRVQLYNNATRVCLASSLSES